MKWRDPRFAGYNPETGFRLPPRKIEPTQMVQHKTGKWVPIYNLIPIPTGKLYSYKGKR